MPPTVNPTLGSLNTAAVQTVAMKYFLMTLTPKTPSRPPTAILATLPPPPLPPIPSQESQNTQLAPAPPSPAPTASSTLPCNRAEFLGDVTIPDGTTVPPGFTFTKTWRVRNSGSCNWSRSYHVVYVEGTPLGNVGDFMLQTEIPPGTEAQISLPLQAPLQGGLAETHWKLRSPDGQVFGVGENGEDPLWVKIIVEEDQQQNQVQPENTAITATEIAQKCSPQSDPSLERQVFSLINVERTKQGQFLLISSPQLTEAARAHSRDMAIYSYVSHTNSDGNDLPERMKKQNITSLVFAENLFHNQAEELSPQKVIDTWASNDSDQANLVNVTFSQVGIGYMYCNTNPKEYYLTAIFAQPN